ncbi:protein of unknown function [Pedobacter insulae]|uniref:DUF4180 domain-containing protein n=2 Tax=Pedobacter insulae TaxID=414048 RepID=A0A1I2WI17_9SPHI|nr:protein of unknown function [Pedobacter insulae]
MVLKYRNKNATLGALMNTEIHQQGEIKIAEITADRFLINDAEDGLQLLVDLYYQGFDKIIIYETNITPAFFDLQNGLAGGILQKFSNFRVQLAIVGNFDLYPSKSLQQFISESNKGRQVNFLPTIKEAKAKLFY